MSTLSMDSVDNVDTIHWTVCNAYYAYFRRITLKEPLSKSVLHIV